MSELDRLERTYRTTFLRFLPGRDETALHLAYQLGRQAITGGLSLLDLVQIHHRVLIEVLGSTSSSEVDTVVDAASDFLVEVLASHEIVRRQFVSDSGQPRTPRN